MLVRTFLLAIFLLCGIHINAQDESNIKLKIEGGFLLLSENSESLGLFLHLEPKLKPSKNTVIGLRLGITVNTHAIENNDSFQFNIDDVSDNGVISFVPSFDYSFNEIKYRPYVGIGAGYYFLATYIDASRVNVADPSQDVFELSTNKQVGLLFRGGFEIGKVIFGLEYNLTPKADINIPDGQTIGTVDYSYFGLSVGYTFGI